MSNPGGSVVKGTIVRSRRARWQTVGARAIWTASTIFVAISLATARSGSTSNELGSTIGQSVPALMLATVGAILVIRLPGHVIGWLLAVGGLAIALTEGASGRPDYGLNAHPGSVPGAIWFAGLGQLTWVPEIACLFILLPLFYPTGRLPSARWRVVLVIAGALVVIGSVSGAFVGWPPGLYPLGNPLALGGPADTLVTFLNYVVGTMLVLAGGALAIASLIVRYRRAAPIERQQLKWFAAVAGRDRDRGPALSPLRDRPTDSRTISWVILTVLVAALFVAFVLVFQAIVAPLTGSNAIAVAGSTLLVFGFFAPIRRRVQRLVDRRFNRSRYDAEQTVAAFAGRLRDQVDLEQLRSEIRATVSAAVEPSSVSLWLRE